MLKNHGWAGTESIFNYIAIRTGSIELDVCDHSREDGAISHDEGKRVATALSAFFLKGKP